MFGRSLLKAIMYNAVRQETRVDQFASALFDTVNSVFKSRRFAHGTTNIEISYPSFSHRH